MSQVLDREKEREDDSCRSKQVKDKFIYAKRKQDVDDKEQEHEAGEEIHLASPRILTKQRIDRREKRCRDRGDEDDTPDLDVGLVELCQDFR